MARIAERELTCRSTTRAAQDGRIRKLPGFGEKTELNTRPLAKLRQLLKLTM